MFNDEPTALHLIAPPRTKTTKAYTPPLPQERAEWTPAHIQQHLYQNDWHSRRLHLLAHILCAVIFIGALIMVALGIYLQVQTK